MKVKCEYCGQQIDESQKICPICGAPMPTANRVAGDQPKTIEELKQWYIDHNLPPERITRFFIGKDIKEPKAFGIYKNSAGDFVVYKNKSNGERVIRYQGTDEGYAVNELYQRLRSEIADQKANGRGSSNKNKNKNKGKKEGTSIGDVLLTIVLLPFVSPVFAAIYIAIAVFIISLFDHSPAKGYYNYNGKDYYYQGSSWYSYDPVLDDWSYASNKDELNEIINSDTDNDYRVDYNDGKRFEDTNWYDSGTSDDDSDWDSDSFWGDSDSSWGIPRGTVAVHGILETLTGIRTGKNKKVRKALFYFFKCVQHVKALKIQSAKALKQQSESAAIATKTFKLIDFIVLFINF